jgi:DNA-binding NarL/FixJ family response regulator
MGGWGCGFVEYYGPGAGRSGASDQSFAFVGTYRRERFGRARRSPAEAGLQVLRGVAVSDAGAGGLLGKRELEVARLVAEGLSNKRIAARLFISERTVATHVGNILNKLAFNSRAQIAGWMASSNP